MQVTIGEDRNVPDSTYFGVSNVSPYVDGDRITIYNGEGRRRGWGKPGVSSRIVFESLDLISIHVGFYHKHGGGQFWRHYSLNGEIEQVEWKSLNDDLRQAILNEYDKLPSWINPPGKLRSQYVSSSPKKSGFKAYKIVRIEDDTYVSLYDDTTYEIGRTKVQSARDNHRGGYYVYGDFDTIRQRYETGSLTGVTLKGEHAILLCECWGNRIAYENGKIAVTYCKPIEEVARFDV